MREILVIGDLHLGRLAKLFPQKPNTLDISLDVLFQLENYASKHDIKHVIQTGDVFDTATPDQETIKALANYLIKSKLEWHFAFGNHDASHKGHHSLILLDFFSRSQKITNCHFYTNPTKTVINKIPLIFLPWPVVKHKILNTDPHIIIAHEERAGMKYDSGKSVNGKQFDLKNHYWIIGHLHEYQEAKNVVFPGAPLQLRYGDSPYKTFLHVTVNTKPTLRVNYTRQPIIPEYVLLDIKISKNKHCKAVSNLKSNEFARLLIQADIAVPDELMNHQQVLKHIYFGDKKDLKAIDNNKFNLSLSKIDLNSRMHMLEQWLKAKKLDNKTVAKAVAYAKAIEENVAKE